MARGLIVKVGGKRVNYKGCWQEEKKMPQVGLEPTIKIYMYKVIAYVVVRIYYAKHTSCKHSLHTASL